MARKLRVTIKLTINLGSLAILIAAFKLIS